MYLSNPPGSWQHFVKRQDNVGLPLMEVRAKYLREQLMYEDFISYTVQQQRQQALQNQGKGKKEPTESVSLNCIQFTADTTSGGTTFGMGITSSAPTTATVDWGDSNSEEIVIDGFTDIQHEYADEETAYSVTMCFADPSVITDLQFYGND
jgi:hypothetical protein